MKIQIRKALVKDARFFYELRNEKTARKNFFDTKDIKYNDHLKWYKNKLKKENVIFLEVQHFLREKLVQMTAIFYQMNC